MSFWKWMNQEADESKVDLLLIVGGSALIGHLSLPGAFGGIILCLGIEYYDYRKSDFDKDQDQQ